MTPAAPVGRVWGGLTPSEREARRREQLVAAGLEVFATAGWNGATVADICALARLSPRYFYDHFGSREALFIAVSAQIAADVEALIRTASTTEATAQLRAEAIVRALVTHFDADPRLARVALVESFATAELRRHRAELLASFTALGARLMQAFHHDPAAADPRSLHLSAAVLSGGFAEILIAAPDRDGAVTPDELVQQIVALYRAAADLA